MVRGRWLWIFILMQFTLESVLSLLIPYSNYVVNSLDVFFIFYRLVVFSSKAVCFTSLSIYMYNLRVYLMDSTLVRRISRELPRPILIGTRIVCGFSTRDSYKQYYGMPTSGSSVVAYGANQCDEVFFHKRTQVEPRIYRWSLISLCKLLQL